MLYCTKLSVAKFVKDIKGSSWPDFAKGFNGSMRAKSPVPIWPILYTLFTTKMGVLVGILLIAFVS